MTRRRLKLVQHIPTGPRYPFTVCVHTPGESYYKAVIKDSANDDRPEFRYRIPKSKKAFVPTPQQVANAAAGQLTEVRGLIYLTRVKDGIPDLSAIYVSNSRQVLCYWSTSPEEAPVEHPMVTDPENWQKRAMEEIEAARAARRQEVKPSDERSLSVATFE